MCLKIIALSQCGIIEHIPRHPRVIRSDDQVVPEDKPATTKPTQTSTEHSAKTKSHTDNALFIVKDASFSACTKENVCQRIHEYSISKKYEIKCNEMFLKISWDFNISHEHKAVVSSYLTPEGYLSESQKKSSSCSRIKK